MPYAELKNRVSEYAVKLTEGARRMENATKEGEQVWAEAARIIAKPEEIPTLELAQMMIKISNHGRALKYELPDYSQAWEEALYRLPKEEFQRVLGKLEKLALQQERYDPKSWENGLMAMESKLLDVSTGIRKIVEKRIAAEQQKEHSIQGQIDRLTIKEALQAIKKLDQSVTNLRAEVGAAIQKLAEATAAVLQQQESGTTGRKRPASSPTTASSRSASPAPRRSRASREEEPEEARHPEELLNLLTQTERDILSGKPRRKGLLHLQVVMLRQGDAIIEKGKINLSVPTVGKDRPLPACTFCRSTKHYTEACLSKLDGRAKIIREQRRCPYCLNVHGGACRKASRRCRACQEDRHHPALCPVVIDQAKILRALQLIEEQLEALGRDGHS